MTPVTATTPLVHLAVPNAETGKIGSHETPLNSKSTACQPLWNGWGGRTLRRELVTCAACLDAMQAGRA